MLNDGTCSVGTQPPGGVFLVLFREGLLVGDADQERGASQERVPSCPDGEQGGCHEGHRRVRTELMDCCEYVVSVWRGQRRRRRGALLVFCSPSCLRREPR